MNPDHTIVVKLLAPCPRQALRLAQFVDDPELPVEPDLARHLSSCAACAAFLDNLRRQSEALDQFTPPPRSSEALLDRIALRRSAAIARELTALSRQLLLLESDFEASFPRESGSADEDDGLLPTARRLRLRWRATDLPQTASPRLASAIAALIDVPPGDDALGKSETRLGIARDLLEESLRLDARNAAAYLLRAQEQWVFGDLDHVADDLDRALQACHSPWYTGVVLLHLSIWHADRGEMSPALECLQRAWRLAPQLLAVHFTLGVYSAATGSDRLARQSLRTASHLGSHRDRIRRMLQVRGQLHSLSQLGVLPSRRVEQQTRDILGTLTTLAPADSWTHHATT